MANNLKEIDGIQTTDDTIPASTSTSSTLSASSGSSDFTINTADANFRRGAWIYDATNSELYKIKDMVSDTEGTIVGTFNDTLSGATVKLVTVDDAKIIQMSIAADQSSASSVNGVALADGTSKSWSTVGNGGDVGVRYVEPKIVLGATDGNVSYIYTKY